MSHNISKRKYRQIWVNGKPIEEHRHVVQTHLGRKLAYDETIHHINGNKADNRLQNLTVIDRREHGAMHGREGSRLTAEDVRAIRSSSLSQSKLAKRFGISLRSVWDIINYRSWKDVRPCADRIEAGENPEPVSK